MLGAVIFDLDGLLIETESACHAVASAMIRSRTGNQLSFEDFSRFVGRPVPEMCGWIRDRYRLDATVDELLAERSRRLLPSYQHPVLMPGAVELVEAVAALGLPMAVASSAPGPLVAAGAAAVPFSSRISAVVSADHPRVSAPKPAPDIYLIACELLRVRPEDALALEDSPSGSLAAVQAGLITLAVPNTWTMGMQFPDGVAELDDLHEALPRIVALLGGEGNLPAPS